MHGRVSRKISLLTIPLHSQLVHNYDTEVYTPIASFSFSGSCECHFFVHYWPVLPHFQENIPLINLVSKQIYHQLNGILIPSSTSIGISALVPQMSFHRDTKWGIVKCWLFSQSNTVHPVRNHQSQHLGDNL